MPIYENCDEQWDKTLKAIKKAASDVPRQMKKGIRRTNGLKT
jgi:hypothetical protein